MDANVLRAGDADRERVAERLRVALDEGRLNLHEYDERLRDAYAAKTYAELDALLVDLPMTRSDAQTLALPASSGALAGAETTWQLRPDSGYAGATRRWLASTWESWIRANAVCVAIWGTMAVLSGHVNYFWPGWVAGPWGAVLLVQTARGMLSGEPQRWAARRARKEAEREVRRRAKGETGS
ncbi:DUF1707 domain-containing protein [Dactylosporangium sp. AC04546]|uniref:DUF1707 SHOCT-like domain-containing protein n=1 Tax=Dactylosporangium sp. AC04546 TaxID=2862460 RepID=UPI001EDF162E|nr:DUF1707 domain-containing protein [Dactylosporangium sp. AC04546]WVK86770.1 DUF1707 domain-containing protein [Dactylosporangium sp. AC04546]